MKAHYTCINEHACASFVPDSGRRGISWCYQITGTQVIMLPSLISLQRRKLVVFMCPHLLSLVPSLIMHFLNSPTCRVNAALATAADNI